MAGRADYPDKGSISAPGRRAFAISPADADLTKPTRAIYVGGTGTLVVTMIDDTVAVTFSAIPVGTILPIQAKRVAAASTATLLVGIY